MSPELRIARVPPPGWEDFVLHRPYPHFEQSSHWAATEAQDGWEARYASHQDDRGIAAGALILAKSVRRVGRVGYVFRGPVVRPSHAPDTPALDAASDLLRQAANAMALRLIVVVPPYDGGAWSIRARLNGFSLHPPRLPPTGLSAATMTVDLAKPPERLEQSFRRSTRQEIKLGRKAGITVDTGGAADLDEFWTVHEELCRRRGVRSNVPSLDYVRALWANFHAANRIWLFRARHASQPLCSLLCVRAGSICYAWRIGWNGMEPENFPTKVLYAEAMRHVAEAGCTHFDFMQIDPAVAQVLRQGGKSRHRDAGLTLFKLGFAGDIVPLPPTLVWLPNPALRLLARHVFFPLLHLTNQPT